MRERAVEKISASGPGAIKPLVQCIAGDNHTAAASARVALRALAHQAAAPGREDERAEVSDALLAEVSGTHPVKVRRWLLRLVSFTGRDESIPELTKLLADSEVGEMAPTFTLMSLDGKGETDLASFRGKRPVVLFFGSYT